MKTEYRCRPASAADYSHVIDMWIAGISSDRVAIEQVADTWWKRLLFRYVAGRKIFIQDLETHVLEGPEGVCGYVGLQYAEDTVSVFDWGINLEWELLGKKVFSLMLDSILEEIYEKDDIESFVLGLERQSQDVREILAEEDFHLLDYQTSQLVSKLPLDHPQERENIELTLSFQLSHSYGEQIDEWIAVDFNGDQEIAEEVIPIHRSLPTKSRIYEIRLQQTPIGFVLYSSHRGEGRFLYALEPKVWGHVAEKLLVTAFCTQLAARDERVRIRTFSHSHMEASRLALEELGLEWEPAPWERWVHLLYEADEDGESEEEVAENE